MDAQARGGGGGVGTQVQRRAAPASFFWPEISALRVFLNFDNERMYTPLNIEVHPPPPPRAVKFGLRESLHIQM